MTSVSRGRGAWGRGRTSLLGARYLAGSALLGLSLSLGACSRVGTPAATSASETSAVGAVVGATQPSGSPSGTVAHSMTAAGVEQDRPALGFTQTQGGKGGKLVKVISLSASGPGSLRAALEESGPRVVMFEVGGVIDLGREHLHLTEPFVTVAGETAPSPGITLIRGGIGIQTHDVIISHLRIRPGEAEQAKKSGWESDGVSTFSAHDVRVEHCSLSWATDENLSASGPRFSGATPEAWRKGTSRRITFSHNIVAEGLSDSTHAKGEHSKGSLIHDNVTEAAVLFSLYASNVERNPFFKGGARGIVVNNWIANPKWYAMHYTLVAEEWGEHPHQTGQMAIVGNVVRYGPDTNAEVPLLFSRGPGKVEVFLSDNQARDRKGQDVPMLGGEVGNFVSMDKAPLWAEGFTALPASEIEAYLKNRVGARPWDRDATDRRIVEAAFSGGGKIIHSERDVEGYPDVAETRAPFDQSRGTTRVPGRLGRIGKASGGPGDDTETQRRLRP